MKLRYGPLTLREQYCAAEPFPHIVLDGLFDDAELEAVLRDFPAPETMRWIRFDNPQEKKLGYFHESSAITDRIRRFLDAMNGSRYSSSWKH